MSDTIYDTLKNALEEKIISHDLADQPIDITCKALSAKQAIGTPDHDDYPIVNNTISNFINVGKPAVFYGVTICAPAKILNLTTFYEYGN